MKIKNNEDYFKAQYKYKALVRSLDLVEQLEDKRVQELLDAMAEYDKVFTMRDYGQRRTWE